MSHHRAPPVSHHRAPVSHHRASLCVTPIRLPALPRAGLNVLGLLPPRICDFRCTLRPCLPAPHAPCLPTPLPPCSSAPRLPASLLPCTPLTPHQTSAQTINDKPKCISLILMFLLITISLLGAISICNMNAHPEVNQHRSAVLPEHYVFRIQIPVDDPVVVDVAEGTCDLMAECDSERLGDNAVIDLGEAQWGGGGQSRRLTRGQSRRRLSDTGVEQTYAATFHQHNEGVRVANPV